MDCYYISYLDKAYQNAKFYPDIELGCLENDDIAEKFIIDGFSNNYQQILRDAHSSNDNSYEAFIDTNSIPILITNDPGFYLLYKGVYSSCCHRVTRSELCG